MDEDNQHLGSTLTDSHDVRQDFLLSFRLLSFLSLFSKSYTYRFDGVRLVSTRFINCCLDTSRGQPERWRSSLGGRNHVTAGRRFPGHI
ncbi:hypothetical protein ATANTOWER_014507 [Ataeniobius toweri]|uniref:Uncharacterized protein n=1 Tax=Ataeniobius toweri TaxID=208326 RepID=A0ABU7AG79_9TELE|nr:hypothetical protein [Ataeniobius toweri]